MSETRCYPGLSSALLEHDGWPTQAGSDEPRLERYRRAIEQLTSGRYQLRLPSESNDPLGLVGCAIQELAQALERRMAQHHKLLEVVERVNQGRTLSEVLEHIYATFRSVLPYDRIGFAVIEQDRVRAVWTRSDCARVRLPIGYQRRLAATSLGQVMQQREARILNDLEAYLARHPSSDPTRRLVAEGMRASLTVPLVADEKPIGFLFFTSTRAGVYGAEHVEWCGRIAQQVAVIVEKSKVYEELLATKRALELANRKLAHIASVDAVTDLPNRRQLDRVLEQEWRRSARARAPLSLILVDIDHFKLFNDTYGHRAGDSCLRAVGQALRGALHRPADFVARYGGEEFAVVLPTTEAEGAQRVALRLCEAVRELGRPHETSPTRSRVTISAGISSAVAALARSRSALIESADRALYQAKANGRDGIQWLPLGEHDPRASTPDRCVTSWPELPVLDKARASWPE